MTPGLFEPNERPTAEAAAALASHNPFLPEWIDLERQVLGADWIPRQGPWSFDPGGSAGAPASNRNLELLHGRAEELAARARSRLVEGVAVDERELRLYTDLVLSVLYHRYQARLFERHVAPPNGGSEPVAFFDEFARDVADFRLQEPPEHLLALVFQFRRAFHFIFHSILGGSHTAGRLRATVWQSIFTHDMGRYRRGLFRCMHDIATLITGPSGAGKELCARAVGLSRYVPFNRSTRRFAEDFLATFQPLNLSALSPTLIESELFGHRKGAFTGALADRVGYLDGRSTVCTVFLDEIGEVDVSIQVKLLRVLESRVFQRLGDSQPREFRGKIIAATNRDLAEEIRSGRFRTDLYYRLCSDLISLPPLAEHLMGDREELAELVSLMVDRILRRGEDGIEDQERAAVADEVMATIERDLGLGYAWPGNMRELEQCVRNVVVRSSYRPTRNLAPELSARERIARDLLAGTLSADALLDRYCTLVYSQTDSYEEAARRTGLDRRTVKRRIDLKLLEALRAEKG